MLRWLILPFALLWWSAAHAADSVTLRVGETVEIRIGADGKAVAGAKAKAAPISDFDGRALAQMAGVGVPAGAKTMPPEVMSAKVGEVVPAIAPDTLRISLLDVSGKSEHDRLLIIENGYGKAVRYNAVLHRGGRATPTDVCLVMPDMRGYEHWPYAFEEIDLSALSLVDWKESDGIPCA